MGRLAYSACYVGLGVFVNPLGKFSVLGSTGQLSAMVDGNGPCWMLGTYAEAPRSRALFDVSPSMMFIFGMWFVFDQDVGRVKCWDGKIDRE